MYRVQQVSKKGADVGPIFFYLDISSWSTIEIHSKVIKIREIQIELRIGEI